MEHKLEVYSNSHFGEIRTLTIDSEPWFVAADVCKTLSLSNSRMAVESLDDDEKADVSITDTSSNGVTQRRKVCAVNEYGLYTLILRSRKPEAKAFKRWITHEVIPAIRRHGIYATDETFDKMRADPRLVEVYRQAIAAEREQKDMLLSAVAEMHPKAEYYDAFIHPYECTNLRITAKELQVPERRFVRFLQMNKYLFRAPSGQLLPYAKHEKSGWFLVKDYCRNGHMDAYTLFTPHGKDHFRQFIPEILETNTIKKSK